MLKIEKVNFAIELAEKKLETFSDAEKRALEAKLEISVAELCAYQELKSIAQATGKIDLDTAFLCYNSLGNWSNTKLATKIVLTQLFAAFLSR